MAPVAPRYPSAAGGEGGTGNVVPGGLGGSWGHPGALGSLAPSALSLLGSSARSEPLWCLLTRLSRGPMEAGDPGDCAVRAPCRVRSVLSAHPVVRAAHWTCTVLSAPCHSCTLFYIHGAVRAPCCTHTHRAVRVPRCACAEQLAPCTITCAAAHAGCPDSAPRASEPLGAFVEAGLAKHYVKNTSSSSS